MCNTRLLTIFAYLFAFVAVWGGERQAVAADRPNIIFVLADDLGYGDLSCFGQKNFTTPNIDSLAAEGMKFTQHYAGCTVCAPSRCALMTGLHTGHSVVRGNSEVLPEGQTAMPGETFTVAHMLRSAGYATGLFGKWGLGSPDSASEPLKMGFDRFFGYNCQRLAHHYYPYFLWNDDKREVLWGNFGLETQQYAPDLIQEQALEFIKHNQDRPFFCYYAMVEPHAEMFAPESYMKKYRGKFLPEKSYKGTDGGPNFRKFPYGSQPEAHAAFAAMVNVIDDDIGELKSLLQELNIAENTLVIFTSDNGPHTEGGHEPAYFNSSGSLRGVKRDLYEGGIRVPMIAWWPGKVKAGTESDHISAFWDVLPTFADAAGIKAPACIDGISFLPTLLGGEQPEHEYLYWEFHELQGRVAMRQGKWKAVRYKVAVDAHSPLELYDLSVDPSETTNVAAKHPDIVAKMDGLIQQARTTSPNPKFNFPLKRKKSAAGSAHEK